MEQILKNDFFSFTEQGVEKKTKFPIKINYENFYSHLNKKLDEVKYRKHLLSTLRKVLIEGRANLEEIFKKDNMGSYCVAGHSLLLDQIITIIYYEGLSIFYDDEKPSLCIVAIGGYGRSELAPYSDIDLLFLVEKKNTTQIEKLIQYTLYFLWDLGLKIGHSTRNISEVIEYSKKDFIVRTSILENRYLIGDKTIFKNINEKFRDFQKETTTEFINFKLKEQDARQHKMGGSRYMLEPNIKESKGGLRDLHTLFWISKYYYGFKNLVEIKNVKVSWSKELKIFYKAQDFLWAIRCHLHYFSKRDDNILNFEAQAKIATSFGYKKRKNTLAVERFMKRFYLTARDVGNLTRLFCTELNINQFQSIIYPSVNFENIWGKGDFFIDKGKVSLKLTGKTSSNLEENPIIIYKLFKYAQQNNLDIHPTTIHNILLSKKFLKNKINKSLEVTSIFLIILMSSNNAERYLRLMSECGVLGRFFIDFQRIVGLMQFDMYHHYTVDEHTLRAIGFLHKIEKGDLIETAPVASRVIKEIQSRKVLFVATFLHDIGKGRGGDHSIKGEDIARKFCPSIGLNEEETETIAWLVRNHLIMSKIAFNYDISDPKTISDFTKTIQSPEKLKLLLVLTVADILAVAPNIWNSWKASLMRNLYRLSEEVLHGANPYNLLELNPNEAIKRTREKLSDWSDKEFDIYSKKLSEKYWIAFDTETQVWHAKISRFEDFKKNLIKVSLKVENNSKSIQLAVLAPDYPGLFSKITGAIAVNGVEILTARIFTRQDGIALDCFWIEHGKGILFEEEKLEKIKESIKKCLINQLNPEQELFKLYKSIHKRNIFIKTPSRVLLDNSVSNTHSVLEINGRDRPGLLFNLTSKLTELGVQIQSASVSTYGDRVVDVFYVKDIFGMKIDGLNRIKVIKEKLNSVLVETKFLEKNMKKS